MPTRPGAVFADLVLARATAVALKAYGPLRFTPALGASIARRAFFIRFVAPRKTLRAAL